MTPSEQRDDLQRQINELRDAFDEHVKQAAKPKPAPRPIVPAPVKRGKS